MMFLGEVAGRASIIAARWRRTPYKGPPPRLSGGPPNRATRQVSSLSEGLMDFFGF